MKASGKLLSSSEMSMKLVSTDLWNGPAENLPSTPGSHA